MRSPRTSPTCAFTTATAAGAGNYSQSELAEWAERIGKWASTIDVFAYFNNDWEEFAPRYALALARLLGLR